MFLCVFVCALVLAMFVSVSASEIVFVCQCLCSSVCVASVSTTVCVAMCSGTGERPTVPCTVAAANRPPCVVRCQCPHTRRQRVRPSPPPTCHPATLPAWVARWCHPFTPRRWDVLASQKETLHNEIELKRVPFNAE